jgi:hypothetical protein
VIKSEVLFRRYASISAAALSGYTTKCASPLVGVLARTMAIPIDAQPMQERLQTASQPRAIEHWQPRSILIFPWTTAVKAEIWPDDFEPNFHCCQVCCGLALMPLRPSTSKPFAVDQSGLKTSIRHMYASVARAFLPRCLARISSHSALRHSRQPNPGAAVHFANDARVMTFSDRFAKRHTQLEP